MQQTPPLMRNESAVQRACSRDNPIKSLIMENIVRHGHESLEIETKIGWDLHLDLERSTSMRVMRVLAMGRFNLSTISQI